MAFSLTKLKELFIKKESTFNTDVFAGNPDPATRIEAEEINFAPTQEFIERAVQMGTLGSISGVVGGKGGKVTFKVGACGSIAASPHIVRGSSTSSSLYAALLASSMRRWSGGQHDTTESVGGVGTTTANFTSSTDYGYGNSGAPPLVARLAAGTSGSLEIRAMLASVSGAAQTVAPAFSVMPAINDPYKGADVWYPVADSTGIVSTPNTATIKAYDNGVEYNFTGCFGPAPKVSCAPNKRAMLEFSFEVTSWTVTSTTAPTPDQVSVAPGNIVGNGASMWWKAASSVVVPVASMELDFGMSVKPVASMTAADGKAGWIPEMKTPTLKVDPYFATTWQTDFSAGTEDMALLQLGTGVAAQTMAVLLPAAQIAKFPAPVDIGGVQGHKIEFRGNAPFSSAEGAAPGLSPAYLAFY